MAESLAAPTPAPESNYGRYWHGYLAVFKPMLSIFTYEQLRVVNAVWVAALGLTVAALMWRRGLRRYILPFAVTVLLFDPRRHRHEHALYAGLRRDHARLHRHSRRVELAARGRGGFCCCSR